MARPHINPRERKQCFSVTLNPTQKKIFEKLGGSRWLQGEIEKVWYQFGAGVDIPSMSQQDFDKAMQEMHTWDSVIASLSSRQQREMYLELGGATWLQKELSLHLHSKHSQMQEQWNYHPETRTWSPK